jgi:signal transduction histidine kinase/ActR/RegA family two-component response regulator
VEVDRFASRPRRLEDLRILVLPPTHADGLAIGKVLADGRVASAAFKSVSELCDALGEGAGAVVLSEEAVLADTPRLLACLASQPMWSDIPLIVLSKFGRESTAFSGIVSQLGNVSVVERPMRMSTLLSLVRSGLRARERQYQVRDFLMEREQLLESERTARSDAERAGRSKDEFLATLSHELRTPLNAVLGWARVLRKIPGLTEEVVNGLTVIERNARSQAQIIGELLDMSRIISGKVRLDLKPVDIAMVVEATIETVKPTAEARGVQLSVDLGSRPNPVHADPNRLQQVLWNLLANALKFTHRGGEVSVKLRRTGHNVHVEITDNGEGIDPEMLPHVFERFRQGDASSTRRHGGLGLGLSIVRQLAELHGGTVSAQSGGPGTGSTFRVTLPAADALAQVNLSRSTSLQQSGPAAADEQQPNIDLQGLFVLVVDDEPDARALVERLLQDCQATVATAASAEEAMHFLDREMPHVIVSDVGMPGTDGYSLMRRIRSRTDAGAVVPAIALTAYVRVEDQARALDAGFQCHLSKPVEAGALLASVERLARESRQSLVSAAR